MNTLLKTMSLLLISMVFASTAKALEIVVAHNPVDCTANLQAAFDGPADVIRIPNVGAAWVTGPLYIRRNNMTVLLDSGVVLLAKLGAYTANGTCLIQARNCQNVTIRGYGASLRMQVDIGDEYRDFLTLYRNHHCLELVGVNNVLVEGLYIAKAGTDGIFIAGSFNPSEPNFSSNITIRDCDMDDNSRQGISVISAQDLLIERCVMRNTGVTFQDLPMAGIDFEPNNATERLVRCTVRDCEIFDNNGPSYGNGVLTATLNLNATSEPVSLNFERCHVTATRNSGHCVNLAGPREISGPLTTITMTDCLIEDTKGIGLFIESSAKNTTVQLTRTVIRNAFTDTAAWGGTPILLQGQGDDKSLTAYGNITFTDCFLADNKPRPFIRSFEERSTYMPPLPNSFCKGLRGNITVVNPNTVGQTINLDFPNNDQNITLAVTYLASLPTQTVSMVNLQRAGYEGSMTSGPGVSRVATNLSFPLAVNLDWAGTAQNRLDYGLRPNFTIIPPAATQAALSFSARTDNLSEGEETVVVTALAKPSDYGLNSASSSATVRVFDTPLPAWRFNQFQTSQNTGIAANDADPDNDGATNLLEYALGSQPLNASSLGSPTLGFSAGRLSLTYSRQAWSDISYTVEAGTNLSAWPEIIQTSNGLTNVAGSLTVTDTLAPGIQPKRFMRLRVSTP